jgi:hypothetical protein
MGQQQQQQQQQQQRWQQQRRRRWQQQQQQDPPLPLPPPPLPTLILPARGWSACSAAGLSDAGGARWKVAGAALCARVIRAARIATSLLLALRPFRFWREFSRTAPRFRSASSGGGPAHLICSAALYV